MRPHVPVLPTRVASVAKAYRRLSRRREVAHAARCCVTNKIGANVAPSDTVGIPQPTPSRDRPRAGLGLLEHTPMRYLLAAFAALAFCCPAFAQNPTFTVTATWTAP